MAYLISTGRLLDRCTACSDETRGTQPRRCKRTRAVETRRGTNPACNVVNEQPVIPMSPPFQVVLDELEISLHSCLSSNLLRAIDS
jgi:hypothetical protein